MVTGNHLAQLAPEAQFVDLFLLKPVSIVELVRLAQRLRANDQPML
jgi:hypothetical protein